MNSLDPARPRQTDPFASTHWSLVLSAAERSSDESRQALETLCCQYWPPLYAYVRRRTSTLDEAHDLTQAFFAQLLEKNYLAQAQRERGRFRAFLLTALKHFLSKEWDKHKAQKRGGGRQHFSLDFAAMDARAVVEPAAGLTPDQIYDRQWALTMLDGVLAAVGQEMRTEGKGDWFDELKGFLAGEKGGKTYAEVAAARGTSEAAVKMAASRLRDRYRKHLRGAIAQTVATPAEVDDEIRTLFSALSLG